MVAILSPARNIQNIPVGGLPSTRPVLLDRTMHLAETLKQYSPWELESLLRVNPKLGLQAFDAFQNFDPQLPGSPALFAYRGIAYRNLYPFDFTGEDIAFANRSLRVLSAFYGVLRPADGILPYRLEFVSRFRMDGETLYRYWGDCFYRELFRSGEPVINLCSAEYAKAVIPYLKCDDPWITCNFFVHRNGTLCCRATATKAARGQMARYLVRNRLQDPRQLQAFHWDGYAYVPELSHPWEYTFVQS